MIRYRSIDFGVKEKHVVEFKTTPFTGFEEVWVDGRSVFRKRALFGIEQTFEVGEKEKHLVRVKSGPLEHLGLEPIFFVDGLPFDLWEQKQKDPNSSVKRTHFDRVHVVSMLLKILGYVAWPLAGLGIVLFFRHQIQHAVYVLMNIHRLP